MKNLKKSTEKPQSKLTAEKWNDVMKLTHVLWDGAVMESVHHLFVWNTNISKLTI